MRTHYRPLVALHGIQLAMNGDWGSAIGFVVVKRGAGAPFWSSGYTFTCTTQSCLWIYIRENWLEHEDEHTVIEPQ